MRSQAPYPEVSYADAHLHLDMFPPDDLPAVVERAGGSGVRIMVSTAMDLASSRATAAIAARFPSVYGAVGIHPWLATEITDTMLAEFRALATAPKVVALGEIGLDHGPRNPDRAAQEKVLRALIGVARETDRRLVIHTRLAPEDTIRILRDEQAGAIGGHIHEFTPDDAFIEACLDMGFFINAGRSILVDRPDTSHLHNIVKRIPLDRLLLETDAAPAYDHGKPVEPTDVAAVAAAVGQLKGISAEEIGAATLANTRRLFRL